MARCPDCDFSCPDGTDKCSRCGATVARVCSQCGAGNPALARFCCGCGGRLESALDDQAPGSLAGPEWRQLTVLFCDVVGSTALGRKLDPEDWHRILQQLHWRCGELVVKHGGYVAQYLGDGLLAYFGYPVATEEAPRQAVAAALEIRQQVGDIVVTGPEPLSVRIGIHTGPVIVGNIGSRRHQESLALGETPTLAARLQEAAPSGAIVISPETKRLVDGFFECQMLGAFQLKGFSQSQTLYRVIGKGSSHTRLEAASAAGLTPFVGRGEELAALKAAWASVVKATPAPVVVLTGEPGIGKSRLIHELRQYVEPSKALVLELRCAQHARNTALHPVLEWLQRSLSLLHSDDRAVALEQLDAGLKGAGLSAQQRALFGNLLGLPVDAALLPPAPLLREATLEAAAAWLIGPKGWGPRLVIIEDVHWADPSTKDLLSAVFSRGAPNVLFVCSARPELSADWLQGASVRSLRPLGAGETRELVTLVAGNKPLPGEVVDRLAARSECLPLFLEEMTKTVIESGLVRETSSEYVLDQPMRDSAIPATLHDSLMGRLDQLGHSKPVAQLAAVLGRAFDYSLFEAVWRKIPAVPGISLDDALGRVVAAQLLIREGETQTALYRFRHSLIQEAAYQSLLRSTRQAYHRYAAQAILERFPTRAELEPELVAYHYSRAEERERAVEFWGKAGQRAISGSAYPEAIGHFKAGLEQVNQLPPQAERSRLEMALRSGLGVTLITSRGFASKDVEETYARAAELCHELGDEIPVKVLYGIWAVNLVRSDLASTTRMLPRLERLAEAADAGTRLVGHAALSTWAFWRGDYAKAILHGSAACLLIEPSDPKQQHADLLGQHGFEGLLYPGIYLTWSQALTGEVAAARDTWRRVSELAERIGDPYVRAGVYAFGGVIHHDLGDLDLAALYALKVRELCQDRPFPIWHATGFVVGGNCSLREGDIGAALESIQQGLKMYTATGAKTPYSYQLKYLAEAYVAKKDYGLAIETLNEALEMMRVNLDRNFEPEVLRVLGLAQHENGQAGQARATLEQALELCRRQGARLLELKVATALAQVLHERGEGAAAKGLLAPVVTAFGASADLQHWLAADRFLETMSQASG